MLRLLVRNIETSLVQELHRRAALHGVSAEEEHRRILRAALKCPAQIPPTLIEFLTDETNAVHPEIELEWERNRDIELRC